MSASEAQPSEAIAAEREWMQSATQRLSDSFRAEKAAEESARAEREAGAAAPVAPTPAPKPPTTPKPATPETRTPEPVAERIEARRLTKRVRDLEAENERLAQQWQPVEQNIDRIRRGLAIADAAEAGDPDDFARAVGHDGWSKLQDHFVSSLSDPGYTRVRELERSMRERDEREQRAQQAQAERLQASRIREYKSRMAEEAKASSHPVIRTFAVAPEFIEALFEARGIHFQETGKELPLEKCLDVKRPNGWTVLEELEHYSKTSDVYRSVRGATTQANPEPTKPKPAPKPKVAEPEQRYGWRPTGRKSDDERWLERAKRAWDAGVASERREERR